MFFAAGNQVRTVRAALSLTAILLSATAVAPAQSVRPTTITRLFWQDRDTDKLSWADLVTTSKWELRRGWVTGFPAVDAEQQDLVSMKQADGVLLVGIQDQQQGRDRSGWVAVDTGVFEEPHGNHKHWKYTRRPAVKQTRLDAEQGNPAAQFIYDDTFYLAHDGKNGFTQVTPGQLKTSGAAAPGVFRSGGGTRISLAAAENSVCYATWADDSGDNAGRVDVVNLRMPPTQEPAYSFKLPTGAIHGTIFNSGRVFFAPADGVCWVKADTSVAQTTDSVEVSHLSLGVEAGSEQPLRASAFASQRNWVMFTTGNGSSSAFCLIDAAAPNPAVTQLPIPVADGLKLTAPEVVLSLGKRYAFMFHDRTDPDSTVPEQLTIVDLDPNRDRNFADAKIKMTIPAGPSKVTGDQGHHSICFDAYGRHAVFTNPGNGIVSIMSLQKLKIVASFRVGGAPDNIVAVGAPEHFH